MTDHELLEQFVRQRSENAFAQIVQRYADLVYRCAQRQTGDSAMAEDVTQAVFILLVRRAHRLGPQVVLAGWLTKVARFAAKDAIRAEARRKRREQETASMKSDHAESVSAEVAFAELRPTLDAALARLSVRDRGLVAMRYLEGMPTEQLASIVGLTPDTVRHRIARAIVRLRGFLVQRGWCGRDADLTETLQQGAHEPPAPKALLALLPMLAAKSAETGAAVSLAHGATRMLRWAKIKAAAAIVGGALLVGAVAGGSIAVRRSLAQTVTPQSSGGSSSPTSQVSSPAQPPPALVRQIGKFPLKFTEPSPLTAWENMRRRTAMGSWARYDSVGRSYDLSQESFQVYAPAAYKPERPPFGLFVWISAGDATIPEPWRPIFERCRMIYVSADNTGNGRDMVLRIALAIDAVHNMSQRFHVDPDRIYIAGFSGGAMAATIAMRGYPDVFSGAFLMSGGQFYDFGEDDDGNVYPSATWIGTDVPIEQAKDLFRIVLLHGSKDYYAIGMKPNYESFMLDDFKHVTHFMIDGMDHQMPGPLLLEKGLIALDKGKPAVHVPVTVPLRPATLPTSRPKMAYTDVRRPLPAHDPDKQAARILTSAQSWFNNGMLEGAEIGARRILADYAGAPCAGDAQVMLDRLVYIKPTALPYGSLNTPSKQALFSGRAAINRNMFDSARLYFSRVAQLSPSAREGKEAAAWIKWMDEHPGQARAKPNSAAVLGTIVFQTGLALDRAGQKEAARTAYQQTIRAYPNTPAASAAAQMLAKL